MTKKQNILFVIVTIISILFTSNLAQAKHLHKEHWYQLKLCTLLDGEMEYRLPDGARVDILTDEYAIEVDFSTKWAESYGQSVYYAICTQKSPGVLLVMTGQENSDKLHLERLKKLAAFYGTSFKIWVMDQNGKIIKQ